MKKQIQYLTESQLRQLIRSELVNSSKLRLNEQVNLPDNKVGYAAALYAGVILNNPESVEMYDWLEDTVYMTYVGWHDYRKAWPAAKKLGAKLKLWTQKDSDMSPVPNENTAAAASFILPLSVNSILERSEDLQDVLKRFDLKVGQTYNMRAYNFGNFADPESAKFLGYALMHRAVQPYFRWSIRNDPKAAVQELKDVKLVGLVECVPLFELDRAPGKKIRGWIKDGDLVYNPGHNGVSSPIASPLKSYVGASEPMPAAPALAAEEIMRRSSRELTLAQRTLKAGQFYDLPSYSFKKIKNSEHRVWNEPEKAKFLGYAITAFRGEKYPTSSFHPTPEAALDKIKDLDFTPTSLQPVAIGVIFELSSGEKVRVLEVDGKLTYQK